MGFHVVYRDIIWDFLLVGSGVQLQPYYIPKNVHVFLEVLLLVEVLLVLAMITYISIER